MINIMDVTWGWLKEQEVSSEGGVSPKVPLGVLAKELHIQLPHGNKQVNKVDLAKLNWILLGYGYETLGKFDRVSQSLDMALELHFRVRAMLVNKGLIKAHLGLCFIGSKEECNGGYKTTDYTFSSLINLENAKGGSYALCRSLTSISGFKVTLKDFKDLSFYHSLYLPLDDYSCLCGFTDRQDLMYRFCQSDMWVDEFIALEVVKYEELLKDSVQRFKGQLRSILVLNSTVDKQPFEEAISKLDKKVGLV